MCPHTGEPGTEFEPFGLRMRLSLQRHARRPDQSDDPDLSVLAMADTGAEVSMIRRKLAEELQLQAMGTKAVFHFGGVARPKIYLARITFGCGERRTIELVDDGGVQHPPDIDFPELLLGRNVLRYAHLDMNGITGSWSLNFDFTAWPELEAL
jgi:predicted aspartyl protease